MKEIIELTEKYLAHDIDDKNTWSNSWMRENDAMLCELLEAIEHRRQLEQTPITEDWLKEYGWKRDEMIFQGWSKTFEVGIREFATLTLVNCYNKGWYINDTPIRVNTIAQLYDALELCGITMED